MPQAPIFVSLTLARPAKALRTARRSATSRGPASVTSPPEVAVTAGVVGEHGVARVGEARRDLGDGPARAPEAVQDDDAGPAPAGAAPSGV